jgi:putative flippase GtrA
MTNLQTLLPKFLKFTTVGFAGLFVDFSITYLLKELLKINKYIANGIGFSLAASLNYILNRIWTFQSHNQNISAEYISFFIISIIGLAINSLTLWFILKKINVNYNTNLTIYGIR